MTQTYPDETLFFAAIDGDDVGPILRDKIISNDTNGASKLSSDIHNYFSLLRLQLERLECNTIFCGGDSLLVSSDKPIPYSWFVSLPYGPCTISVGISSSPEYAYLALQLAKARGKNQVVQINELSAETIHKWPQLNI
jgi:hypothetical protein